MKFFLLYVIGTVNLVLGYVCARRWRHPPVPAAKDMPAATLPELDPDEVLQNLQKELAAQQKFFSSQQESLNVDTLTAKDLEEISSETDVAAQTLLKTITAACDALVNDGPDKWQDRIEQLEDDWASISDSSLQLVTLTFDDEAAGTTREQLQSACDSLQRLCAQAGDALRT